MVERDDEGCRFALNHNAPTNDGEIVGVAAAKRNPVADLNAGTDRMRRCGNVRADMRRMTPGGIGEFESHFH
jgi:hypothetical protein